MRSWEYKNAWWRDFFFKLRIKSQFIRCLRLLYYVWHCMLFHNETTFTFINHKLYLKPCHSFRLRHHGDHKPSPKHTMSQHRLIPDVTEALTPGQAMPLLPSFPLTLITGQQRGIGDGYDDNSNKDNDVEKQQPKPVVDKREELSDYDNAMNDFDIHPVPSPTRGTSTDATVHNAPQLASFWRYVNALWYNLLYSRRELYQGVEIVSSPWLNWKSNHFQWIPYFYGLLSMNITKTSLYSLDVKLIVYS